MKTIHVRSIVLAAVSAIALVGSAPAQDRPSGLLNAMEVRQLVERGEPADHASLGAHFTALDARYAAEAKRHATMANSFLGNPNRNLGASVSEHCRRLADINTQSATTARELAAYHKTAAAGTPAKLPRAAEPFEDGLGAPDPTERELNALAAKARTTVEHRALEEHFLTLARRYTAEAERHAAFAQTYRGTRLAQAAVHHERLDRLSRDAAKEANEAAAMHSQFATVAR